jgi:hypothetical protein
MTRKQSPYIVDHTRSRSDNSCRRDQQHNCTKRWDTIHLLEGQRKLR